MPKIPSIGLCNLIKSTIFDYIKIPKYFLWFNAQWQNWSRLSSTADFSLKFLSSKLVSFYRQLASLALQFAHCKCWIGQSERPSAARAAGTQHLLWQIRNYSKVWCLQITSSLVFNNMLKISLFYNLILHWKI